MDAFNSLDFGTKLTLFLALAGIAIALLIPLVGFFYKQFTKLRKYYSVIWQPSSSINPVSIMGIRGRPDNKFKKYYYERTPDSQIAEDIKQGKNILITGNPLAGKSRALLEALKGFSPKAFVLIPELEMKISTDNFRVPRCISTLFWRKKVLVLDDLDKYVEKEGFPYLMAQLSRRSDIILLATCRAGRELDFVKSKLEREFSSNFFNEIEIPKIERQEAEKVAEDTAEPMPESFDGNIGSIFFDIQKMRQRYATCTEDSKAFLRSIKRLYLSGIYEGKEEFSIERIKKVYCAMEGADKEPKGWATLLEGLKKDAFLEVDAGKVTAEQVYIEEVFDGEERGLPLFKKMMEIFKSDPEALFSLGHRAYSLGLNSLKIAEQMRFSIAAYGAALKIYTLGRVPLQYGITQNNLGVAYKTLAEVVDKAANCGQAIAAYEEALKVYTPDRFPVEYSKMQNNLGITYKTLAEVEDMGENCRKAIAACEEALKVYTLDRFPLQYGITQNNLGTAYKTLAGVAEKGGNCRKAIAALEGALRVRTLDRFPMDYGMTQNNLGTTYRTLAEVEDTGENCRKAIAAFKEALKVYTPDQFPMDYGGTLNNLGNTYGTLAGVEEKRANCQKAITVFEEAFKVITIDRFPILYGIMYSNLGNAYITLAEEEDKGGSCRKAEVAYGEALKVFDEKSP